MPNGHSCLSEPEISQMRHATNKIIIFDSIVQTCLLPVPLSGVALSCLAHSPAPGNRLARCTHSSLGAVHLLTLCDPQAASAHTACTLVLPCSHTVWTPVLPCSHCVHLGPPLSHCVHPGPPLLTLCAQWSSPAHTQCEPWSSSARPSCPAQGFSSCSSSAVVSWELGCQPSAPLTLYCELPLELFLHPLELFHLVEVVIIIFAWSLVTVRMPPKHHSLTSVHTGPGTQQRPEEQVNNEHKKDWMSKWTNDSTGIEPAKDILISHCQERDFLFLEWVKSRP